MKFYSVTTAHLSNKLMFRDDEDFRVGMNYVAILSFNMELDIMSFILMSNHTHFLVGGDYGVALSFANEFKLMYSRYMHRKYDENRMMRRIEVYIEEVQINDESFHWCFAYFQMNAVAANICLQPSDYPWGTGNCFFKVKPVDGVRIRDISDRTRFRILKSKKEVPSEWVLSSDGYILPDSYVKATFIERLFSTPKRMSFFLNNSSKAKLVLERGENDTPAFKDQDILHVLPSLCSSLFGRKDVSLLNDSQKAELLKQIKYRFSSNIHQLCRVVGMEYEEVTKLLDTAPNTRTVHAS